VDPYYHTHKAEAIGYHPQVILAGRRINDGMGAYVVGRMVKEMLRKGLPVHGGRVLILGLSFKENCPDLRNTRVVDVHDPMVESLARIVETLITSSCVTVLFLFIRFHIQPLYSSMSALTTRTLSQVCVVGATSKIAKGAPLERRACEIHSKKGPEIGARSVGGGGGGGGGGIVVAHNNSHNNSSGDHACCDATCAQAQATTDTATDTAAGTGTRARRCRGCLSRNGSCGSCGHGGQREGCEDIFHNKDSCGGHVLTATIGEKIFPFNEWSRYFA
jgi:hypothetical protein